MRSPSLSLSVSADVTTAQYLSAASKHNLKSPDVFWKGQRRHAIVGSKRSTWTGSFPLRAAATKQIQKLYSRAWLRPLFFHSDGWTDLILRDSDSVFGLIRLICSGRKHASGEVTLFLLADTDKEAGENGEI